MSKDYDFGIFESLSGSIRFNKIKKYFELKTNKELSNKELYDEFLKTACGYMPEELKTSYLFIIKKMYVGYLAKKSVGK